MYNLLFFDNYDTFYRWCQFETFEEVGLELLKFVNMENVKSHADRVVLTNNAGASDYFAELANDPFSARYECARKYAMRINDDDGTFVRMNDDAPKGTDK